VRERRKRRNEERTRSRKERGGNRKKKKRTDALSFLLSSPSLFLSAFCLAQSKWARLVSSPYRARKGIERKREQRVSLKRTQSPVSKEA